MARSGEVGTRGELFARLALSQPMGDGQALFRAEFLGDKYPGVDLIVEVRGTGPAFTPVFFVQVKATNRGYLDNGNLRVQVTRSGMRGLVAPPVPTYIFGVDTHPPGRVFIMAAVPNGPDHFPSLPTAHELDRDALRVLYDEVIGWQAQVAPCTSSRLV